MLPLESKIDSEGLLHIDDALNRRDYIRFLTDDDCFKYSFLAIPSTSEYIVKYYNGSFTIEDTKKIKKMLLEFNRIREQIPEIDFPIGYYQEEGDIKGLIIYYYKKALSLRYFSLHKTLDDLSKYYLRDDNKYRNLILLYQDILELIEKMLDEKVYYLDVHSGNFVLHNNSVKLIDFEINQMAFSDEENELYKDILLFFRLLVNYTNSNLGFEDVFLDSCNSFSNMKKSLKKLEKRLIKSGV